MPRFDKQLARFRHRLRHGGEDPWGAIIQEVREQFKEKNADGVPLVLAGEKEADSIPCVQIATQAAIVEMLMPGTVAVLVPVVIGLGLGTQPVVGMLAGSTVSATMLALTLLPSASASLIALARTAATATAATAMMRPPLWS